MKHHISHITAAAVILMACLAPASAETSSIIIKDGDRIAFLGDSITAGGAGDGGYCQLVIQGLKTVGINASPVFAGNPGDTSSSMLMRLKRSVLDHKPTHLFIAAGVNDIWHSHPALKLGMCTPTEGHGVELEYYKIYMKEIVDRAEADGIKVILSTITPITEDPEFKTNKESEEYNAFLHSLARERGLPVAELNKAMFDGVARLKAQADPRRRTLLTSDGVHPIAIGHQVMAKGILKTLGLTDEELAKVEKAWNNGPVLLVLGDLQARSGGRTGGWRHMIMDGLNIGPETVNSCQAVVKTKVADLAAALDNALVNDRIRYLLLQSPSGDPADGTPLDEYRKAAAGIMDMAQKKGVKLAVATIPILGGDDAKDANEKIDAYSKVIRDLAKQKNAPLVDINAAMHEYAGENPGAPLTISQGRFNHETGVIMAKLSVMAFGVEGSRMPAVQEIWDNRSSYTRKYTYGATFTADLSGSGRETLDAIEKHHHKPGISGITQYGMYLLLHGDPKKNKDRIDYFNRHWLKDKPDSGDAPMEVRYTQTPSTIQARAMRAYMQNHDLDLAGLYLNAFKIGTYALRKEDVQGRGNDW